MPRLSWHDVRLFSLVYLIHEEMDEIPLAAAGFGGARIGLQKARKSGLSLFALF